MTPFLESFVFGAANSLHCACMCGPLAFSLQGGLRGAGSYHLGRTTAYGTLGVVLGGIGAALGAHELSTPTAWVAWVLAAGLVVLACLGERWTVSVPFLGPWLQKLMLHGRTLSPSLRGALLGFVTPFLPCGLLWAACASAAVAGSPLAGGAVMTGFALGSLPLLFLAQTQMLLLSRKLSPRQLLWISRGAMLLAAGMLIWRGIAVQQSGDCCH